MKPYYEHAGITIYHGDCREILPQLPKCDLLLTDPPYGINRAGNRASASSHGGRKAYEALSNWDDAAPDAETFAALFASAREHIIWGANYFPQHLSPSMGWLVWDKAQRIRQSDGELAYTSRAGALRIFDLNRAALMLDGAEHPTQKPVSLIKWCLSHFQEAETVLDPFMGSGTTLLAGKSLGRKVIGIEIEERYCEIATKRLAQEVFDFA